jgi:hypothetical protein
VSEYRLIPLSGKLGEGKFTKVSSEDYDRLACSRWYENTGGYVVRRIGSKKAKRVIYMHREIMGVSDVLAFSNDTLVDHINHDTLDNRRENLRLRTHSQNMANTIKKFRVQYKGVRAGPQRGTFTAFVADAYLGQYRSAEDAAQAYDAAARYLFGEFAYVNFPDGQESLSPEEILEHSRPKRSSVYIGVQWEKRRKRWIAHVHVTENGKDKPIYLGSFKSEIEAAKARDAAVLRFGTRGRLNFPEGGLFAQNG